jgi:hypothetical protein
MHAAGFTLKPGGTVAVAGYSSGPIGRLTASHSAEQIKFLREKKLKAGSFLDRDDVGKPRS